jgi:hypothetical protein
MRWAGWVVSGVSGSDDMTTKRLPRLLSMAATCLLCTSCFDSKVPLADPGKSKLDERHDRESGQVCGRGRGRLVQ